MMCRRGGRGLCTSISKIVSSRGGAVVTASLACNNNARGARATICAAAAAAAKDGSGGGGAAHHHQQQQQHGDLLRAYTDALVRSRAQLLQTADVEVARAAGVTFEGRQAVIAALRPGAAVIAAREPDNPYDANAVRLELPGGEQIGYLPRTHTGLLLRGPGSGGAAVAAVVESAGPADGGGGPLGARVRLWPSVAAVTIDALPPGWANAANPEAVLGPDAWRGLQARAIAAAGHRCQVTGAAAAVVPLEAVLVFSFLKHARAVAAAGLLCVAAPIARARRLDVLSTPEERAAALALVLAVNAWRVDELDAHVARAAARRQALVHEGWALDLRALAHLAGAGGGAGGAGAAGAAPVVGAPTGPS